MPVDEPENIESEEDTEVEPEEEKPKEQPKESPEDKLARLERQAKQLRRKLGVEEPAKSVTKKEKQSDEFNDGQLAYLAAKGIESEEDTDWVRDELKKHGGNLRELFNNEYFQAKQKARRDTNAALAATPSHHKRSGQGAQNEAEVHYAKYMSMDARESENYLATLPREMRQKLVNMRLQKTKKENQFTDNPVVGNY